MTRDQLIRQLTWMSTATSYATFLPPSTPARRAIALVIWVISALKVLDPTSAKALKRELTRVGTGSWMLWNHPLRPLAIALALERAKQPTLHLPRIIVEAP